ncbi:MAG: class I SAM-dependent methyltransferase [Rhodospirillaceae bacterium]|nr:class I SAM-dependent methyltransferase [Rhodospirillaceae bacterium]
MTESIDHDLKVNHTKDESSRQNFVQGMRSYVLNDLSGHMKTVWDRRAEPAFKKARGRKPADGPEVHKTIKSETLFKFYSAMRCNTQEMVWRSVMPAIEREGRDLSRRAQVLSQAGDKAEGTVTTDSNFQVPRYTSELDVHMMPGNYHEERIDYDVTQGAVFDNGLSVFSFGLLGDRMEDITDSVSTFYQARYTESQPKKILDLGCTLGHSTLPWKARYPDAEVHGVDVGGPCVRYAHARAQSYGVTAHFHQMDAEHTDFEDESFDIVYSCMFLHEVPLKNIKGVFKEAHRLLKPGGVMLHYELPPNSMTSPYDGFYLDWDSYYNKEPFYKAFRDADAKAEIEAAGFEKDSFFEHVAPSRNLYGQDALMAAAQDDGAKNDSRVGRFGDGVMWYFFGAHK